MPGFPSSPGQPCLCQGSAFISAPWASPSPRPPVRGQRGPETEMPCTLVPSSPPPPPASQHPPALSGSSPLPHPTCRPPWPTGLPPGSTLASSLSLASWDHPVGLQISSPTPFIHSANTEAALPLEDIVRDAGCQDGKVAGPDLEGLPALYGRWSFSS